MDFLVPNLDFSWGSIAISLLEVGILLWVVKYLLHAFSAECTNIPSFNVEVPKISGGKVGDRKNEKDAIVCYNPATLELLGVSKVMSGDEVRERVRKARASAETWRKTSFAERRRVLRSLMEFIVNHQEDLSFVSLQETGKTAVDAVMGEIFVTCEKIKYILENGEYYLKDEYRFPGMLMMHKSAYIQYSPYGVIGIIIPWNFPVHNAISHIVTALFSGNGAVVKVSEWASWSSKYLQDLTNQWLTANGYSPDLVSFVTGYGETGAALVSSADKILFIGSPEIGKKVMEKAAETVTPVTLELGGKDPFVICEDANLDYSVQMALRGAFLNCGQNCVSAERFFVYDRIYDRFIKDVLAMMPKLTQGPDAPDVGAINMPGQLSKYEDLIHEAVSKGAKVLAGGKVNKNHAGQFFEPTVLVDVTPEMKIFQEECFGPGALGFIGNFSREVAVMSVIRVKNDEEVLKLANQSKYGLGCSIFSSNYDRANRLARQIAAGCTCINDWGLNLMVQSMPFGGCKVSGFGKFNGVEGLRDFVYQKVNVTDRFRVILPPPAALFYPTSSRVHLIVQEFIKVLYARSLVNKARAVLVILKKIVTKDV